MYSPRAFRRNVGEGLAPPACCEFAPRCRVCAVQRLPLVTKGSCRRRRLKGSERCRFAERYQMARQNVHLLIPSVTASPRHRLAAARSRRGSDSPPGCHGAPRRRFATLVTKGRQGCVRICIGAFNFVTLCRAGGVEPRPYGSAGGNFIKSPACYFAANPVK